MRDGARGACGASRRAPRPVCLAGSIRRSVAPGVTEATFPSAMFSGGTFRVEEWVAGVMPKVYNDYNN